jgi:hypothetical protein
MGKPATQLPALPALFGALSTVTVNPENPEFT